MKFFQNPSCHILEKINENHDKKEFLGYDDALKIYGAPNLCTVMYETTVSNHPEVIFWVKYQKLSKVEII